MDHRLLPCLFRDFAFVAGTGLVLGLVVAFAATAFSLSASHISALWLPSDAPNSIAWRGMESFGLILCATLSAALFISLIRQRVKAPWSSPADVILSAQYRDQGFSLGLALLSTLIAFVSIIGGASVGQYGPLVVFGATLALAMSRHFELDFDTRQTLIAAGAAAAISAAFSAPLGGMIFAHEVILRHYRLRSFATVAVTSAIAYAATLLAGGEVELALKVGEVTLSSRTYGLLLILGVLAGGLAVITMRLFDGLPRLLRQTKLPFLTTAVITAFLLAIVGNFVPQALGIGTETVSAVLAGEIDLSVILVILVVKLGLTALCLAGGYHGGVFSPALVIGVLFGAAIALLGSHFGMSADSDLIVLIYAGLGAVVSAVIGGPLSTIIIVYELTRSHDLASAITISVLVSCLISAKLFGRSIFDVSLLRRGFKLSLGDEERILDRAPLTELLERNALVIDLSTSLTEARERFRLSGHQTAFIVNHNQKLFGKLNHHKLVLAGDEQTLESLMEPVPAWPDTYSQLQAIADYHDPREQVIAIVDKKRVFLGYVTAANLLSRYSQAHDGN